MTALDSASLKFWESVGLWGFIFVWVGVAGEGVEIFIKLFQRKLYERKQFCLDVIGAAFWVVLVVALAVEFWGNVRAMRIADSINSQLDAEAGKARKDAGAAIERAAIIESNNVVLSQRVEWLRSNNIALEQQMAPREIEQFAPGMALSRFAGINAVIVAGEVGDSVSLAGRIRTILQIAHWNVSHVFPTAQQVWNGVTVSVCFTNQSSSQRDSISDAADMLISQLNKGGVAAQYSRWLGSQSRIQFDGVFIVIGEKPTADEAVEMKMENEENDIAIAMRNNSREMWATNSTPEKRTELERDIENELMKDKEIQKKLMNLKRAKLDILIKSGQHVSEHDDLINPEPLREIYTSMPKFHGKSSLVKPPTISN